MNHEDAKSAKKSRNRPRISSRSSRLRGKKIQGGSQVRYVVLHHTGIENPHFDLMVELQFGSDLATWRVAHWPPKPDDTFVALPNHRRDYLEYEGPVSNNRGEVKRITSGELNVVTRSAKGLNVSLDCGLELSLPEIKTVSDE
jgi:hypothetical protein